MKNGFREQDRTKSENMHEMVKYVTFGGSGSSGLALKLMISKQILRKKRIRNHVEFKVDFASDLGAIFD